MTRQRAAQILDEHRDPKNRIYAAPVPQEIKDLYEAYRMGADALREKRWTPIHEGFPPFKENSNYSMDCIVCVYGNAGWDDFETFEREILTGKFRIDNGEIAFEPDRFTEFIPEDWDYLDLDKEYKCHHASEDCTYYTDDSCTETEFHDRYIQILAWMPLPKPYEPQESEVMSDTDK